MEFFPMCKTNISTRKCIWRCDFSRRRFDKGPNWPKGICRLPFYTNVRHIENALHKRYIARLGGTPDRSLVSFEKYAGASRTKRKKNHNTYL